MTSESHDDVEAPDQDEAEIGSALDLLEAGEPDQALALLRSVLPNCSGLTRAECLRWIAAAESVLGADQAAAEALTHAATLLTAQPFSALTVECDQLAGRVLAELRRPGEAVPYLRAAVAGLRRLAAWDTPDCDDPEWIAEIADSEDDLARALTASGEHAAALPVFRAASAGFHRAGRRAEAADSRFAGAWAAVELEDATLVRDEFAAARALFEMLDAATEVGHCSYLIGSACVELGDDDQALTELRRARIELDADAERLSVADCDLEIGKLLHAVGRDAEAMTAISAAATEYAREGKREQSLECHWYLTDLHIRIGLNHMRCGRMRDSLRSLLAAREALYAVGELDKAAELDQAIGMCLDNLDREGAVAAYARARKHYSRHGRQLDVLWCDVQIVTARIGFLELATVENTLRAACTTFEEAGDQARLAQCRRFLASAVERRSDHNEARSLLDRVYRYALTAGDEELHADCCQDLGNLLVQTGHYDEGIAQLTEASRVFDAASDLMKAAVCRERAGVAHFFQGRHAVAEDLLYEARAVFAHCDAPRWLASVEMELGLIYCDTGRFEESEHLYRRAREAFRAQGLRLDEAVAEANLGGLSLRRQDLDAATAAFTAAERIFQELNLDYSVAVCRQNLGAVATMRGDATVGRELLGAANAYFAGDPSFRWNTAATHRNLAVTETRLSHWSAARAHLAQARRLNAELGMCEDLARCDLWAAILIVQESANPDLWRALDLGLPAMLFIEAQRFQYPYAATRVAWAELNAEIRRELFRWAHRLGDASVLGDLVEISINAGVHVTEHVPESTATTHFASIIPALDADMPDSAARATAAAPPLPIGGAAALIAGATLPMRPPPRLLMPDGHVALGPQLDSADQRYGTVDRGPAIPTW